ncbi:tyrosine-type recombinase/integrase [Dehalococcoidia bacterium]|nr:tyrosine-type recombinase/integrase [Dehalococcoidia bacterium]MCL0078219.1 tyrosine-type recombinase/integrase [Dehalococcoidia bacterium]
MSADTLLNRYRLVSMSEGLSNKTIQHVMSSVRYFDEFLGGIADINKVTADDLRGFILALQQKKTWSNRPEVNAKHQMSGSSINTYCRGVKAFWSWLNRQGIINENQLAVVKAPKIPKRLPKVLTEEEVKRVLEVANSPRDRAIIEVLLDTGMRLSELSNIKMSNYNYKARSVTIVGKGDKQRQVFLSLDTTITIGLYWDERPEPQSDDALFLTEDGYPLTAERIQKILERIGNRAGLAQRLSPHRLRHTYATMSLRHGANLEHLRITMGHTSTKVTEVYLQLSNADVAEAHREFSPVANLGKKKRRG